MSKREKEKDVFLQEQWNVSLTEVDEDFDPLFTNHVEDFGCSLTEEEGDDYDYDYSTDVIDNQKNFSLGESLSEQISHESISRNSSIRIPKRNKLIAECTERILQNNILKVCNSKLRFYNTKLGSFEEIENDSVFIETQLDDTEKEFFLTKDLMEILNKIYRNPSIQANSDDFNRNSNLANCLNGVVNIESEKPELIPHNPKWLFNYCINAKFLENEEDYICNSFDNFCITSLNGSLEKRDLLLTVIGYIMSDSNDAKAAMFFKGEPNSGKSVILDFVTSLIGGKYVSNIMLDKLAEKFFVAELFGKKVNIAGEIKSNKLSDIATFKMITGSDKLTGQYKNCNPFTFTAKCKLLFSGNCFPRTSESDSTAAFTNRLVILLFNSSISKENQDKNLRNKLYSERDAIFTLSMKSLNNLKENNYVFKQPLESLEFIRAYSESQDSVKIFIDECCSLESDATVLNVELLEAYNSFCNINGLETYAKSKVYTILSSIRGVSRKKIRKNGENRHGHLGIRIN